MLGFIGRQGLLVGLVLILDMVFAICEMRHVEFVCCECGKVENATACE